MKRNRGAVIIQSNNKVLLIKRKRENQVYYVFPGGGIEKGETAEEAAKREALEELGVRVNIHECLQEVEHNGTQYYFRAEILEGEIGTGVGEEFTDQTRNRGSYHPMWIDVTHLTSIGVRPREVADRILES
ncbi:NUDIX domain-containing protein [Bacillus carboniphilus]|uniref:NUDIX domain-containing protein n=1 Tax=Bacillus carboniphilus TaxID=86663 RepID=A0ABN0WHC0_9BACI